jgi:hypothetical protein
VGYWVRQFRIESELMLLVEDDVIRTWFTQIGEIFVCYFYIY